MIQLCKIEDAAAELGIPERSLRTAAEQHGFIVRMGRAVRLERERLGELVKRCRDQPKELGSTNSNTARIVTDAGLSGVTPHTLKHTAITWALQNGATVWDCAGFFATSAETIQRVYGHHAPDYQASALKAVERR